MKKRWFSDKLIAIAAVAILGMVGLSGSEARGIAPGGSGPGALRIERDIPDYLVDSAHPVNRTPAFFYSGRKIRLMGVPSAAASAQAEIVGEATGVHRVLTYRGHGRGRLLFEIPSDTPTDQYSLTLRADGRSYIAPIRIQGLTAADTQFSALLQPLLPMNPAVLGISELNCGSCFWELAFAGDRANLVLAGHPFGPTPAVVSHNGASSWQAASFPNMFYRGDPKSYVTSSGTFLLASLTIRPHPVDQSDAIAGGFFKGAVTGNIFQGSVFKDPPSSTPLGWNIVADRPTMAYSETTGTLYIHSFARFDDGTFGFALYTSHDLGNTFTEQNLNYQGATMTALAVTPQGGLRGVTAAGNYTNGGTINYNRFSPNADSFVAVPAMSNTKICCSGARVSSTSNRTWAFYKGPEIAIDNSTASPHFGRAYMLWAEPQEVIQDPTVEGGSYDFNDDVYLAYSDDDGNTWSARIKINDDATIGDQGFPSIRIDSQGTVHMAFIDRREFPNDAQFDVYYAQYKNGKVTPNLRVNNMHVANSVGGRAIGDYLDMVVAFPDKAYVAYPCKGTVDQPTDACVSTIDPRPDLLVTAVSGPTSAVSGSSIVVSDTVANQAWGHAEGSFLVYFLSTDNVITFSDTPLNARFVSGLAEGETNLGSINVTIPANQPAGNYYIGAIVDAASQIAETNETNNAQASNIITIAVACTVQYPVTQVLSLGPGTDLTNDEVAATFTGHITNADYIRANPATGVLNVCANTTINYAATTTKGTLNCLRGNTPMPHNGLLQVDRNIRLMCSNISGGGGDDVDVFSLRPQP